MLVGGVLYNCVLKLWIASVEDTRYHQVRQTGGGGCNLIVALAI